MSTYFELLMVTKVKCQANNWQNKTKNVKGTIMHIVLKLNGIKIVKY